MRVAILAVGVAVAVAATALPAAAQPDGGARPADEQAKSVAEAAGTDTAAGKKQNGSARKGRRVKASARPSGGPTPKSARRKEPDPALIERAERAVPKRIVCDFGDQDLPIRW